MVGCAPKMAIIDCFSIRAYGLAAEIQNFTTIMCVSTLRVECRPDPLSALAWPSLVFTTAVGRVIQKFKQLAEKREGSCRWIFFNIFVCGWFQLPGPAGFATF